MLPTFNGTLLTFTTLFSSAVNCSGPACGTTGDNVMWYLLEVLVIHFELELIRSFGSREAANHSNISVISPDSGIGHTQNPLYIMEQTPPV